jgi:hypothetical protein
LYSYWRLGVDGVRITPTEAALAKPSIRQRRFVLQIPEMFLFLAGRRG